MELDYTSDDLFLIPETPDTGLGFSLKSLVEEELRVTERTMCPANAEGIRDMMLALSTINASVLAWWDVWTEKDFKVDKFDD